MIYRILILLFIVSCASNKPTKYQKEEEDEGYSDSMLEGLKVSSFKGNSYTKKDRAQLYAQFRAIENCRLGQKGQHANIIDIFNNTVEKEITRSSGSTWGPSYFGMYPYYSRYSSFGLSAGINTMSGSTWNETLTFPKIDVYYNCADKVFRPKVLFRELTAEQINHLVKDVKGAIQIDKILDHSPNLKKFESGDIILRANGERIEKVYEFIRLFDDKNKSVDVKLLREGKPVTSKMSSQDITKEVEKNEKDIIKKVCAKKNKEKNKSLRNNKLCN